MTTCVQSTFFSPQITASQDLIKASSPPTQLTGGQARQRCEAGHLCPKMQPPAPTAQPDSLPKHVSCFPVSFHSVLFRCAETPKYHLKLVSFQQELYTYLSFILSTVTGFLLKKPLSYSSPKEITTLRRPQSTAIKISYTICLACGRCIFLSVTLSWLFTVLFLLFQKTFHALPTCIYLNICAVVSLKLMETQASFWKVS